MPIKIYFCTVVLSLLTACATTEVKESYNRAEQNYSFYKNETSKYLFEKNWWREYNSIELNNLIELGFKNNTDLLTAALTAKKAFYQAKLAGAQLVPTLAGSWDSAASKTGSNASVINHSANFSLDYEVDIWGKVSNAAAAKKWEYRATGEDYKAAELTLVNSIINTYFSLVYLNDSIDILKRNIEYYAQIKSIVTNKFNNGATDRLNVAEAESAYLEAENNLVSYENEKKLQMQVMRNLLNLKPSDNLNIDAKNILLVENIGVDLGVPLSVIAERPDIRAYEYRLRSYFKNFESSQESLYPSVTLTGSLSYKDSKFKNTFNVPTTGGAIGVNLPFLNWNQIRWNIKTDQVSYEQALLSFENGITTALNEINTNYITYQNKEIEFKNLGAIFKSNTEVSKYYKDRYDAGVSEFRDWLSALATKNNSELKMISTKYDLISAEAKIYQSLSGKPLKIIEGVEL